MHIAPFFQPIVNSRTNRVVGHEVLAREIHEDGKITSAYRRFSTDYSSYEEIIKLDRTIRKQALKHFADSQQPGFITLNISPEWFMKSESLYPTIALIDEYNINPEKVVIEITEKPSESSSLINAVKLYREKGIQIAIDDFGAGFSSFERVAEILPDIIKIDMQLFKSAFKGGMPAIFVDTLCYLADRIDSQVLVEGVESIDEYQYAKAIGSELMQGFIFDPAMADLQFEKSYGSI